MPPRFLYFQMPILAKALYDNKAETLDEITFKRGDVLTILEKNTSGVEGWWLVSHKGQTGIAPGNRLKVLAGMYDGGGGQSNLKASSPDVKNDVNWNRRSWLIEPDKVGKINVLYKRFYICFIITYLSNSFLSNYFLVTCNFCAGYLL